MDDVGPRRYIKELVQPHVVEQPGLEALYQEAANDQVAEREAQAWIEAIPDEALE